MSFSGPISFGLLRAAEDSVWDTASYTSEGGNQWGFKQQQGRFLFGDVQENVSGQR
jgi:hypothetical protein